MAILHRVTVAEAGPVDSSRTDRSGRYALTAPALDTLANFVVSVEHDGIAYFTEPIHTFGTPVAGAEPLLVYDTSSAAPPIVLRERHVVVRSPGGEGARRVIELLLLENRGTATRVASDTTRPVWEGAIPAQAIEFQVGESDVSAEAVIRRGDRVTVTAPVPPGERQILISYLIPTSVRRLALPIDQPVERFFLLLEDSAAVVDAPLAPRGVEQLEQLAFRRYGADSLSAGTLVAAVFPAAGGSAADWWWIVILVASVALAGGFLWWWRRIGPLPAPADGRPSGAEAIAAEIAALDAAFEERQDDPAYRERRAELKARLVEAMKTGAGG
jgi:hypothetical protein